MRRSLLFTVAFTLFIAGLGYGAETYTIDPAHSSATFSIRHIVSQVKGRFTQVSGTLIYDAAAPEKSSVTAKILAASINTDNERRDAHLKGPDFFDVEKYPEITFQSKGVRKDGERFAVTGTLAMHGVEREVVLSVELLGVAEAMGKKKAGFEATTTLNRKDFGIVWNRAMDQGGFILGDEVKVTLSIEADLKAEAGK